jgi:hypothetical protein
MIRTLFLIAVGFIAHAIFEALAIWWDRPAASKALGFVYLLAAVVIVARLLLCVGGCDA